MYSERPSDEEMGILFDQATQENAFRDELNDMLPRYEQAQPHIN